MGRGDGPERPPDRDRGRHRDREEEQDRRDDRVARQRERRHDRDSRMSHSPVPSGRAPRSAPSPDSRSDISSSSDEDSSDAERRRRDRKKRKSKEKEKKSHRHKEKSSKSEHKKGRDEKKRKHKSKHSSDDDASDSETSSDYKKKRRLLKEAKKLLKKHKSKTKIVPMEPAPAGLKIDNISEEDYFAKSIEFALWLKEAKGLFFSNLSSEETHKLFSTFVEIWNAGKLSAKYYQGITAAPRTTHKWGIKLNSNENALLGKDEDDIIYEKKLQKLERKKFNKDQEVLMDELLPKATGREALLEKKALRREQARTREDSPEIFREKDVMGGGDDFQQRLARERAWKEKKAAAKTEVYMEKRSAFEEREAAAMIQFKAMVNMSGGKIVIPKRNDTS
jgi:hypothetical protein